MSVWVLRDKALALRQRLDQTRQKLIGLIHETVAYKKLIGAKFNENQRDRQMHRRYPLPLHVVTFGKCLQSINDSYFGQLTYLIDRRAKLQSEDSRGVDNRH